VPYAFNPSTCGTEAVSLGYLRSRPSQAIAQHPVSKGKKISNRTSARQFLISLSPPGFMAMHSLPCSEVAKILFESRGKKSILRQNQDFI